MCSYLLRAILRPVFIFTASIFIQGQTTPPDDHSAKATDADQERQVERRNWKLKRGAKELGIEVAYSPMQATFLSRPKSYDTDGRKFVMASVRFGRVIGTVKHVTYEYLFEAIPVSFAIKNEVRNPLTTLGSDPKTFTATTRENTFGLGFQPISFRFLFMPSKRLKPYLRVGGGILFTSKPIPVPKSTRYGFNADFGGGLMFSLSEKRTINVGYRYFHISNMSFGEVNPGYNANVFYVGYSLFSK